MSVFSAEHLPALIAGLGVAAIGAPLSVFVVLKRLAFIGQGVSHAAFGGVGVALFLGVAGASVAEDILQMAIVLAFSIGAALVISALGRTNRGRLDTAIGIVLSASMALGFVLFTIAESRHDHDEHGHAHGAHADEHHVIEEILFGNILNANWNSVWVTLAGAGVILGTLWWLRHRLVFWSFDEPVCAAYGVREQRTGNLLLVLLAIAVVLSMQVVGVILAAAVLVLPGAAALHLSSRLDRVMLWSLLIALGGTLLGFVVGDAAGWPIGPSIVLVQSLAYLTALGSHKGLGRLRSV
ncbi:MAG: metal ABC transporter permease [Phycisphaerales bacterium]|nr:metal ABC transporter permease [Phycisphaerales bacterium]